MATDKPMQLGMVGLGSMGSDLVRRFMHDKHCRVVYDAHADAVESRGLGEFHGKILSAMCSEFGGHAERKQ